jgi:hypothetical protein
LKIFSHRPQKKRCVLCGGFFSPQRTQRKKDHRGHRVLKAHGEHREIFLNSVISVGKKLNKISYKIKRDLV